MLDACITRNNLTLTVGVIIGGLTTILLIRKGAQLFSKITKRTIAEQSRNKCHVCNVPINLDKSSDFVTCNSCKQSPICKNLHCAIWIDKTKVWNCKLCRSYLHGSSSACDWLISQLNEKLLQGKGNGDQSKIVWSNNDDNAPLIPLEQREKVREFVEELVSNLVGGPIDNAPVGQLFENKECLPTGENETDTIDQSHSNLKQLVQRIIEEVFKIPELFDHSGVPKEPQRIDLPHFDPKKYEELLATAVLNKLVESYSYERRFENSSGIHSGSDIDGNVQSILHKAQLETLSTSSSNEPRSDSSNSVSLNDQPMSLTATDYIGNLSRDNSVTSPIDSPPQTPRSVGSDEEAYLSDYIQKHKVPLPGIDAHDSDSFDEDYQSVNSNDTEGNWQENWLFKKRKLRNEMKSDIGMLVPSPMEDVKAFIGDKTTDEVSDLSEAGSDMEDEVNETVNGRRSADLPHALVESKTIIGGKNEFVVFPDTKTIDELLQPDSLVSAQSAESIDVQSPVIMEAINDLIFIEDSKPVVLHVTEKRHNGKSVNDIQIDKSFCVQNGSGQSDINLSTKSASKDVSTTRSSVFDVEGGEPPIPTPRKKSKSLESAKGTVAVEVPIRPKIQESESLPDNNTIVTQIIRDFDFSEEVDRLLGGNKAQPLDDELLDSSINDIYDSIEGDHTLDYQSLIAENESVNTVGVSTSPEFILEARNLSMEDVLTETTQEIPQEQLQNDRFNSLNFIEPTSGPTSNISNESYICKVAPTEFDLSVDSVLQPKPDILDVIATDRVEEKSVHQAMFMSTKPALIAVELASHDTSTVQTFKDDSPKKEPTTSIPTLIISNICGDAPPTPVTSNDDDVSLKPKKVLRAQDSLELPPDDREKFEPTKRVDLFELKDVDGKINDKLENAVDSEVNCVGSGHEGLSTVAADPEKPVEEDFVIVTEEEVKALKIEEEESQIKSQESEVDDYSSTDTKPENSLSLASEDLNENKVESPNENAPSDLIQTSESELVLKNLSTYQPSKISETHTTELSIQPESNESIVLNARKVFELATIPELVTQATVVTKSSASSATNTTSNLFTSNQEIILSSNPSTNNIHLEEHGPLPGSIAEREHLKWMNAQVDMPNNPYSPEALQRRLSQTKSPSKVIDINLALAAKPVEPIEDVTTNVDNGKPLQIVLGAGEPDQLRYGRDYYINDSKSACGTRKKTSSVQRYSSTDDDNISSKPTTPDSDVFTARIVQIRDDSGHTSDDSTRLKLSIVDRLSDNSSSLSLQSDSIQSDDSETRVYDLRKNETAYLRSDIIRTSRIPIGATATPPPTPIDGESVHKNLDQFFAIKQLNQLKKSEEEQDATSQQKSQTFNSVRGVSKPLSPETLKFFTPKSKPVFTSKFKMEETGSIKPLIVEREDNVSPQNGTIEKGVIEEDVISSLPSVRALAKNFIEPTNDSTKQPIQRPKTFAWQVSNEIGNNTNGHTKEPTTEFSIPNYETRYHPVAPGHSITARSLSTKFREELKHSISDDASNGSDNIEIVEREHSPDRPPSPVLLKGIFKEKMSFFQNLENK